MSYVCHPMRVFGLFRKWIEYSIIFESSEGFFLTVRRVLYDSVPAVSQVVKKNNRISVY
jgi:hypothetical protein